MLIYLQPRTGRALGCVPCMLAGTPQLGALDFSSAGLGAGTILALAAAAAVVYAFAGTPAKERRRELATAKQKYRDEVRRIKSTRGRFGRKQ
jgi:hypothetical protein